MNLLNLLVDKEIVPEILQENCTVVKMTQVLRELLQNGQQDLSEGLQKLGQHTSPSEKVAEKLIQLARDV